MQIVSLMCSLTSKTRKTDEGQVIRSRCVRGLVKLQWWKKSISQVYISEERKVNAFCLPQESVSKNWMNGTFQINGTKEKAEAGKCF